MTNEFPSLTHQEQRAVVNICISAALADGTLTDLERAEIKRIAGRFSSSEFDLTAVYQEALAGKLSWRAAAGNLQSANARALAYEMAVCLGQADRAESAAESEFLARLREALGLGPNATFFQQEAATLRTEARQQPPIIASATSDEIDAMIVNRAILSGALELMPQTLATMAIIPLQVRTVYSIGKRYGHELDWAHAKEFLATAGVGMASQMVEGYLSKLIKGATRRFAGKTVTALAGQAAESALAFGTTYALGQAAKAYYSGGRKLSTSEVRNVFSTMLDKGNAMKSQYAGQILDKSRNLNVSDLFTLGKNKLTILAA